MGHLRRFAIVSLLACGAAACASLLNLDQVSYDDAGAGSDAQSDAPPAPDTGPSPDGAPPLDAATDGNLDAGPPCDLAKTFANPRVLTELSTSNARDQRPRLTADELTIYFASTRGGNAAHLYTAHRQAIGELWDTPVPVTQVNSGAEDTDPMITPDGGVLFFVSNRNGAKNSYDVMFSTKVSGLFTLPVFANMNTTKDESDPFAASTGDLWFGRLDDAGTSSIYRAANLGDGAATPVNELNAGGDYTPVLSADALTVYFASYRLGTLGGLDIWRATRANPQGPFMTIDHAIELSSPADESPGWLSPDGCRIYFDSRRVTDAGVGDPIGDLWIAERPR